MMPKGTSIGRPANDLMCNYVPCICTEPKTADVQYESGSRQAGTRRIRPPKSRGQQKILLGVRAQRVRSSRCFREHGPGMLHGRVANRLRKLKRLTPRPIANW
jgi:hypothetical protein